MEGDADLDAKQISSDLSAFAMTIIVRKTAR